MEIYFDGPGWLQIMGKRFSITIFPGPHLHGWYRDSYRSADKAIVKVVNFGRLIRFVRWSNSPTIV